MAEISRNPDRLRNDDHGSTATGRPNAPSRLPGRKCASLLIWHFCALGKVISADFARNCSLLPRYTRKWKSETEEDGFESWPPLQKRYPRLGQALRTVGEKKKGKKGKRKKNESEAASPHVALLSATGNETLPCSTVRAWSSHKAALIQRPRNLRKRPCRPIFLTKRRTKRLASGRSRQVKRSRLTNQRSSKPEFEARYHLKKIQSGEGTYRIANSARNLTAPSSQIIPANPGRRRVTHSTAREVDATVGQSRANYAKSSTVARQGPGPFRVFSQEMATKSSSRTSCGVNTRSRYAEEVPPVTDNRPHERICRCAVPPVRLAAPCRTLAISTPPLNSAVVNRGTSTETP